MRQKLSFFTAVLLVLAGFMTPHIGHAQTITLEPSAVPNGVSSASGQQFHQRMNVTLGGTAVGLSRMFTITAPPELTIVTNSATVTTATTGRTATVEAATASSITLSASIVANGFGGSAASTTIFIEFDVTTPNAFAGVGSGAKVDTAYTVNFSTGASSTNRTVSVAKHNDLPIRLVSFTAPDSVRGDTTTAGGRYYKMGFASSSELMDISHRGLSGLTASMLNLADSGTDINYSFYLSTDSTLIRRPSGLNPAGFYTLDPTRSPLIGSRQNPRAVPNTFVREGIETTFGTTGLDTLNGVLSLEGTQDNTVYYIYVLPDPGFGRFPSAAGMSGGATAAGTLVKKGYDPTTQGAFTAGNFIGRSGPLLVQHPPEFVVAGWDFDDDGGDAFATTGVIQVPSDIVNMSSSSDNNRKDNRNITLDSGQFFGKASSSFPSANSGLVPRPQQTVSLLYQAQDADNSQNYQMAIFLSTTSGLKVGNLVGAGIDSLDGALKAIGSDTLGINQNTFLFNPIVRDSVTNLITSFVPEGDYFVYFAATDGTYRTVYQVLDDPFISSPTATTISVKHSPIMTIDSFSLNDFGGDGDLDVITGIGVSQMTSDTDGRDLGFTPAQRYVNLFWGSGGLEGGDLDVDDNATIDLYYSTRSDFRSAGKSFAYTSGNSTGADLLGAIAQGNNDTHLIVSGLQEDPDGQYDDNYQWDLWTYVSPENTIPMTNISYYIYGILKGGTTTRLVSFTESSVTGISPPLASKTTHRINFEHPPYARAIEPSRDITVSVDDPFIVSWEAFDVDNAEAAGGAAGPIAGVNPSGLGRVSPNGRSDSPNVRIFLVSADFGEVTTWASLSNATSGGHPVWLANSGTGGYDEEVELNEGVDTSFVVVGKNMMRDLGVAGATATDLGTNAGVGATYYVYVSVDGGRDGTVADQAQFTFDSFSPAVRAPGRVTFTGTVPTAPITNPRFYLPRRMTTGTTEIIKIPVIPDTTIGQTVGLVNLYMTADNSLWEAIDTDPNTAGIQPFTLGSNSAISASNVQQSAYTQGSNLRLDFIYDDQTTGLTFFNGHEPLAFLNLRSKALSGSSTVNTSISVDNSGSRQSKIFNTALADLSATVPQPLSVDIVPRTQVSGTVPLEGRAVSADTVTFFLREVGDLNAIADTLFNANDVDPARQGVQVATTGVNGSFTLSNVPEGRYILVANVQRHLSGHDTIDIQAGVNISNVLPTIDGAGVDRALLQAGDAAGYADSLGRSIPDNTINSADINAINSALFAQLGDTAYNTFADMNRDSVVNGQDKFYASKNSTDNTGATGIVPVFPTFKQVAPQGSNVDAVVSLAGIPEGEVNPGDTFDVTVLVQNAKAVHTYELQLDYDTDMLAVEDLVSNGSLLEHYTSDMAGGYTKDGIGFVNSILGNTPYGASGEGSLATIRFRAIGRAAETQLKLSDAMLIGVDQVTSTPKLDGEAMIVLSNARMVYHDAAGNAIHGLILPEADAKVDFNDFIALTQAFGADKSSDRYDMRADLNGDDVINFADFVMFSQDFNKVAVDAHLAKRAGKTATAAAGVNAEALVGLSLNGVARMGEAVLVTVDLQQASELAGWGVTVAYDSEQYVFVNASAPEGDMLSAAGGSTPLFLVNTEESGRVSLANALTSGAASGDGQLAVLTFQPKGVVEDGRFEIVTGALFDGGQLANPIGLSGLEVRAVPAEFALTQNFPNPFNPETTISYDLAENVSVSLEIYNVMGQLVHTLVNDTQSAGRYQVRWVGDDALGRQVASGIYFYRLQAGDFSQVRKLMLLK